jgi:hypothetical protein
MATMIMRRITLMNDDGKPMGGASRDKEDGEDIDVNARAVYTDMMKPKPGVKYMHSADYHFLLKAFELNAPVGEVYYIPAKGVVSYQGEKYVISDKFGIPGAVYSPD